MFYISPNPILSGWIMQTVLLQRWRSLLCIWVTKSLSDLVNDSEDCSGEPVHMKAISISFAFLVVLQTYSELEVNAESWELKRCRGGKSVAWVGVMQTQKHGKGRPLPTHKWSGISDVSEHVTTYSNIAIVGVVNHNIYPLPKTSLQSQCMETCITGEDWGHDKVAKCLSKNGVWQTS